MALLTVSVMLPACFLLSTATSDGQNADPRDQAGQMRADKTVATAPNLGNPGRTRSGLPNALLLDLRPGLSARQVGSGALPAHAGCCAP